MKFFQKFYPHALAFLGFIFLALAYFSPVLEGKKLYQSDIIQYTAMAKEQNDFRATENAEPYWTNSAFGGMPTYQLGAKYPHNYIKKIDEFIRFLPRPADYLFLYFASFYILLLVLKVDPLKAFFGALAFGFSTYLIVILGAGHNAKAHALGYIPLVIAGFLLVFRKRYIVGGLLTLFAFALELNANHFQMTYYFMFLLLFISVYYGYKLIKEKDFSSLYKVIATFTIAIILAIGANATGILATKEYTNFSTRGTGNLTFNPDGSKKEGTSTLDKDYITQYSYGIAESLNLIAPRLFGGSNVQPLSKDSEMVAYLQTQPASETEMISEEKAKQYASEGMPLYWGDQPGVSGPAYIGAVVFFLFVVALFHDKRKLKYVFLTGAIFSLVLSWGKNFSFITDLFIGFMPLYDKFRAVSSIQVVLELCVPALAILGLQSFMATNDNSKKIDSLKKATATVLGLLIVLFLGKSMFSFSGLGDAGIIQNYGQQFLDAIKTDRKSLYSADLLRSFFFVLVAATTLWFFVKNKLSMTTAVVIIGFFMVSDLYFVDRDYVKNKDFVAASEVDSPYEETPVDQAILKDKSNFRVFEVAGDMSNARPSYFHKSIGGYSAVKPRKMQELFDYQIAKNNIQVLDMLNVKYIITQSEKGQDSIMLNSGINGNAWFVKELKTVQTPDEEMKALTKLDTKNVAVQCLDGETKVTAIQKFETDSLASIQLLSSKSNDLVYQSKNKKDGLAVFSEMYYKNGWNAYIDGKLNPHFKVNYTLRALQIPSGNHKIEFKFEPQVVKTGSLISLISFVLIIILLFLGVYFEYKKKF